MTVPTLTPPMGQRRPHTVGPVASRSRWCDETPYALHHSVCLPRYTYDPAEQLEESIEQQLNRFYRGPDFDPAAYNSPPFAMEPYGRIVHRGGHHISRGRIRPRSREVPVGSRPSEALRKPSSFTIAYPSRPPSTCPLPLPSCQRRGGAAVQSFTASPLSSFIGESPGWSRKHRKEELVKGCLEPVQNLIGLAGFLVQRPRRPPHPSSTSPPSVDSGPTRPLAAHCNGEDGPQGREPRCSSSVPRSFPTTPRPPLLHSNGKAGFPPPPNELQRTAVRARNSFAPSKTCRPLVLPAAAWSEERLACSSGMNSGNSRKSEEVYFDEDALICHVLRGSEGARLQTDASMPPPVESISFTSVEPPWETRLNGGDVFRDTTSAEAESQTVTTAGASADFVPVSSPKIPTIFPETVSSPVPAVTTTRVSCDSHRLRQRRHTIDELLRLILQLPVPLQGTDQGGGHPGYQAGTPIKLPPQGPSKGAFVCGAVPSSYRSPYTPTRPPSYGDCSRRHVVRSSLRAPQTVYDAAAQADRATAKEEALGAASYTKRLREFRCYYYGPPSPASEPAVPALPTGSRISACAPTQRQGCSSFSSDTAQRWPPLTFRRISSGMSDGTRTGLLSRSPREAGVGSTVGFSTKGWSDTGAAQLCRRGANATDVTRLVDEHRYVIQLLRNLLRCLREDRTTGEASLRIDAVVPSIQNMETVLDTLQADAPMGEETYREALYMLRDTANKLLLNTPLVAEGQRANPQQQEPHRQPPATFAEPPCNADNPSALEPQGVDTEVVAADVALTVGDSPSPPEFVNMNPAPSLVAETPHRSCSPDAINPAMESELQRERCSASPLSADDLHCDSALLDPPHSDRLAMLHSPPSTTGLPTSMPALSDPNKMKRAGCDSVLRGQLTLLAELQDSLRVRIAKDEWEDRIESNLRCTDAMELLARGEITKTESALRELFAQAHVCFYQYLSAAHALWLDYGTALSEFFHASRQLLIFTLPLAGCEAAARETVAVLLVQALADLLTLEEKSRGSLRWTETLVRHELHVSMCIYTEDYARDDIDYAEQVARSAMAQIFAMCSPPTTSKDPSYTQAEQIMVDDAGKRSSLLPLTQAESLTVLLSERGTFCCVATQEVCSPTADAESGQAVSNSAAGADGTCPSPRVSVASSPSHLVWIGGSSETVVALSGASSAEGGTAQVVNPSSSALKSSKTALDAEVVEPNEKISRFEQEVIANVASGDVNEESLTGLQTLQHEGLRELGTSPYIHCATPCSDDPTTTAATSGIPVLIGASASGACLHTTNVDALSSHQTQTSESGSGKDMDERNLCAAEEVAVVAELPVQECEVVTPVLVMHMNGTNETLTAAGKNVFVVTQATGLPTTAPVIFRAELSAVEEFSAAAHVIAARQTSLSRSPTALEGAGELTDRAPSPSILHQRPTQDGSPEELLTISPSEVPVDDEADQTSGELDTSLPFVESVETAPPNGGDIGADDGGSTIPTGQREQLSRHDHDAREVSEAAATQPPDQRLEGGSEDQSNDSLSERRDKNPSLVQLSSASPHGAEAAEWMIAEPNLVDAMDVLPPNVERTMPSRHCNDDDDADQKEVEDDDDELLREEDHPERTSTLRPGRTVSPLKEIQLEAQFPQSADNRPFMSPLSTQSDNGSPYAAGQHQIGLNDSDHAGVDRIEMMANGGAIVEVEGTHDAHQRLNGAHELDLTPRTAHVTSFHTAAPLSSPPSLSSHTLSGLAAGEDPQPANPEFPIEGVEEGEACPPMRTGDDARAQPRRQDSLCADGRDDGTSVDMLFISVTDSEVGGTDDPVAPLGQDRVDAENEPDDSLAISPASSGLVEVSSVGSHRDGDVAAAVLHALPGSSESDTLTPVTQALRDRCWAENGAAIPQRTHLRQPRPQTPEFVHTVLAHQRQLNSVTSAPTAGDSSSKLKQGSDVEEEETCESCESASMASGRGEAGLEVGEVESGEECEPDDADLLDDDNAGERYDLGAPPSAAPWEKSAEQHKHQVPLQQWPAGPPLSTRTLGVAEVATITSNQLLHIRSFDGGVGERGEVAAPPPLLGIPQP